MSEWWSADPVVNAPAATLATLDPAHRDLAIRTIYGEAANEPDQGQAAVAAVIKNRMQAGRYGGDSVPGVVLAKNQFEPWWSNDGRSRMMALKQNDPIYQKIGGIVDQVFGGQMEDPTGGATHFVAPAAQAALGRNMPSWAQGDGQAIGRHTFFAPEGRVQQATANWWANDPVAQPDSPARFSAPPEGGNFRTVREGMSEPAPPPPGIMDKLAQAWANPAPGGLMSMVKPITQGVNTMMQAGHGDIPMTGPDGHTNPAVIDASWEAAKGLTPMTAAPGGVAAAAIGKGLPVAQSAREAVVPAAAELKAAATAGYKAPEVTGLEIKPTAINEWSQATKAKLTEHGLDDTQAAGTWKVLDKLEKAPDGAVVTGQNIHSIRKTLGNAAREKGADGGATPNAVAARSAIEDLDALIPNLAAKDVVKGDPAAAAAKWTEANANYTAFKQAQALDNKVQAAELRASSSNSGQNVANAIRQNVRQMYLNPKVSAGWSPEVGAAAKQIIEGTAGENTVRWFGNVMGGGGGMGALLSGAIGGTLTGGPGMALPVAGFALNSIANRMTQSQAAKLSEMIRSSAPLANTMNDFEKAATEYVTRQTPRAIAQASLAARNLSNNLRDAGFSLTPADIMRSLQGPVKSAADNNQQN